MEYTPLSQEQKDILNIYNMEVNGCRGCYYYGGDQIHFFFNGEVVGITDLPDGTLGDDRMMIAEMIGIKEFDDFHFVKDGVVRFKANELKLPYGSQLGKRYKYFLQRNK